MTTALEKPDRQQLLDAFFKGEVHLKATDVNTGLPITMGYEPDKFLYNIGETSIVRLPRGGWAILDCLVPVILEHVNGPIVEIGMGESTEFLVEHADKYDRKLYSCDIQMGGMFRVCDEPLFEDHILFIDRSEYFMEQYDGDDPAVVFVDGEHTSETVKLEVDFFLPRLAEGGVMFMHDTFPQKERLLEKDDKGQKPGDIYKVRQELERNPEVDVFTWPYTALGVGLTMVMKHSSNNDRPYWLKNGRV